MDDEKLSADIIAGLIRESFRALTRCVEDQFQGTELGLSEWLSLKLVDAGKICCVGDINREIGLESGASTRLVDQLERKGLLYRERCHLDRRVVKILATEAGRDMVASTMPRIKEIFEMKISAFNDVERELFVALLTRLRDSFVVDEPSPSYSLGGVVAIGDRGFAR